MKKDINDEIKEMMEKINLAILSELTSGDHVFKSLMEGYEAKKKIKEQPMPKKEKFPNHIKE